MPTYEYQCNKCGERFDVFQSFSEAPLTKHPGKCRGKVVKVMSPAGIVFSGSGFYKTDSRSDAKKNGSSEATSSTSETPKAPKTDSGSKDSSTSTKSTKSGDG